MHSFVSNVFFYLLCCWYHWLVRFVVTVLALPNCLWNLSAVCSFRIISRELYKKSHGNKFPPRANISLLKKESIIAWLEIMKKRLAMAAGLKFHYGICRMTQTAYTNKFFVLPFSTFFFNDTFLFLMFYFYATSFCSITFSNTCLEFHMFAPNLLFCIFVCVNAYFENSGLSKIWTHCTHQPYID